ncbi:CoA transferase [Lottiidibacillus patelloidae]|uniref:CoA transferase n=1 Tax=Lottiidibacillus patelloidae TaxID=2670334 RepID=A0A263BTU7_9BACI|nr:CaiB/BaiF CoA-transferase family protein [Lottiidibacillus patelloidae]OZM57105.1 CoA transferase [Lottiidibacillus patelloidae]
MKALPNIKVLDLTRVLAGPYCTMILGDLGADVIKVEAPGGSDDTRKWGPPFIANESAYYLCTNRNKRALTINLRTVQGRNIIKKLVKSSDVIIHNFKTGAMEKWGLSYEELSQINEQLIFCSISGFGETGPLKGQPGYDAMIQAMGGLMSITGSKESGPTKVGVAVADLSAGLYATIAILAALNERNNSGKGQKIDISLFDTQIAMLANVASNYLISGKVPELHGNEHPNIVPYQPFHTKDGQLVVAVGNDTQFEKLCQVIGLDSLLADSRFATNAKRLENREELLNILKETILNWKKADLHEKLVGAGIPSGPIQNVKEVFEHPQTSERNMVVKAAFPNQESVSLVGSPLKMSRTKISVERHPPKAGEHTEEILTEHGFSEEEIALLKKENVI